MKDTTKQPMGSDKMDPHTKHDTQNQDMGSLGQKGGQAAQQSGKPNDMKTDDRMKGGMDSNSGDQDTK